MEPQLQIMMEKLAKDAATGTVTELLTRLGMDTSNPFEVQRDMIMLREMRLLTTDEEFQADLRHIREWRTSMAAMRKKSVLTIFGIIVTGLMGTLIAGFKGYLP